MRFNPLDPAFLNDPYPFFRALRETAPIHYEETIGGWMFTGTTMCPRCCVSRG